MPKNPILLPQEAEAMLLKAGFILVRSSGSHRVFKKGSRRIVIPFHAGRTLHPKVVKQVLAAIEEVGVKT